VFVTGGFACAILLLSLLNYPLLLFIEVRGQNLLWWLSVFTLLIVAGLQFRSTSQANAAMPVVTNDPFFLDPMK